MDDIVDKMRQCKTYTPYEEARALRRLCENLTSQRDFLKSTLLRVHEVAVRPIPDRMNVADACQRDLAEIISLTEEVALSE